LAIPKKSLIRAFVIAREILHAVLHSIQAGEVQRYTDEQLLGATKVLLLHDPEHLTAANWRKRYIVSVADRGPDVTAEGGFALLRNIIAQEFAFMDSLLMSPLNKHSKSPTLWFHRYWLLKIHGGVLSPSLRSLGEGQPVAIEETRASLRSEIGVVLKAADTHKSNYHAFLYARRVLGLVLVKDMAIDDLVKRVQRWAFVHPRDISGWTFLAFLLEWNIHNCSTEAARLLAVEVRKEALAFVEDLSWSGLSVNAFLNILNQAC
jgi:hypothetical protein